MNKKLIVRSILGILIFIFSSLFWLSLSTALNDGSPWLQKSLWSLAAFLFLGVGSGLAYLMEDRNILFYGLPLLIILPALMFLKEDLTSGLVLAIAFLFLVFAAGRADFEKKLRTKFVSWVILKKGYGPFITAIALIVTLFFYFAPFTQSLGQKVSVPRPLFDAIVEPVMSILLPLAMPAGQNLESLPSEFYRQQAEMMDKLYLSTNEELASAWQAFKEWLPMGMSVSLFFTFKIVGTFLSWLMILAVWLIFRILLWSGVIKIEKVATEKEVIIM
ncbi:hypothetical protein KJ866_01510 [Patescibacteria group bacterium]|nr:hypothetical protein [Patescibacteria group bacterium]MBU2219992.1 hypothetical protein [Patescibacteria group bacterium]MBU2264952.1 hypothetical protein [Patescibacteria group bacterium]